MRVLIPLLCIILFIIIGVGMFIYTGGMSIAATEPHSKFTRQVLHFVMETTVKRKAENIKAPAPFDDAMVKTGFTHYDEMCAVCHGAPGIEISEMGKGLNPAPPDLVDEMKEGEWNSGELFWIVKNGIKFSGMPGFGPSHTDEEIWAIVAFLERLPKMTPEEYNAMVEAEKGQGH